MAARLVGALAALPHDERAALPVAYGHRDVWIRGYVDEVVIGCGGEFIARHPRCYDREDMVFDPVHPYSRGLMRSILVPEEGTRDVKLTAIPGTPPNLKHPPAGCRFAERCRYATPACRYNQPPLLDFDEGRSYRCMHAVNHLKEVYASED